MARPTRPLATRILMVLLALSCAVTVAGCKKVPRLTKAQLDEAKLPEKHRKLTPETAANCRNCHREKAADAQ